MTVLQIAADPEVETQVSIIDRIRELEARADASEDEAIRCKYEAARLIAEELDRRQGGARPLAREIGKSHTHVLNMERVHRRHGHKPHVRSISEWNKIYKGKGPTKAPAWPRVRHVTIRTPRGLLAEAVVAVKSAVRTNDKLRVAREIIAIIGEDVVRRALDPSDADPMDESPLDEVDPPLEPAMFMDGGDPP